MLAIAAQEGRRPDLAAAELLGRNLCARSSGDTGPNQWTPQFNTKAQITGDLGDSLIYRDGSAFCSRRSGHCGPARIAERSTEGSPRSPSRPVYGVLSATKL